jgi:hypothetical protein
MISMKFRLLTTGASLRLTVALLLIVALWGGFFWATTNPGAS